MNLGHHPLPTPLRPAQLFSGFIIGRAEITTHRRRLSNRQAATQCQPVELIGTESNRVI
jgi:hypothetical protein